MSNPLSDIRLHNYQLGDLLLMLGKDCPRADMHQAIVTDVVRLCAALGSAGAQLKAAELQPEGASSDAAMSA